MSYFYHQITRKYVVAFAHLFRDINIVRKDTNGDTLKTLQVPIVYGGKSKIFQEVKGFIDENKAIVGQHLPRMGFIISGMDYDSTRKLSMFNEYKNDDGDYIKFTGVPYDFTFDLSVLSKNQDDMFQIIEQIVTMFTPDLSVNIIEVPELSLSRDISINLDGVSLNNIHEFGETEERVISTDFTFTLKGCLYPKVYAQGNIIEKIITDYRNMVGSTPTADEKLVSLQRVEQEYDELTESIIKTITTDIT